MKMNHFRSSYEISFFIRVRKKPSNIRSNIRYEAKKNSFHELNSPKKASAAQPHHHLHMLFTLAWRDWQSGFIASFMVYLYRYIYLSHVPNPSLSFSVCTFLKQLNGTCFAKKIIYESLL